MFCSNQGLGRQPNEDWLKRRIDLFDSYTLLSVVQQSCPKFAWLIFCDRSSPAWLAESLYGIADSGVHQVWIDGPMFGVVVAHEIRDRSRGKPIITTLLDNDDVLAVDFVERVQSIAVGSVPLAIDFRNGLQLLPGGTLVT